MLTPDSELLAWMQPGMDVCDAEHHPIGRLGEVYRSAPYGTPPPAAAPTIVEPWMRVNRDAGDLYIPTRYISDVTGDCVVLNVTGDRIPQMGWQNKPDFIQDVQP